MPLLLLLMLSLQGTHSLTVMSVDFGAEFMKVAVVAAGLPMEIALNKESKRKTPVAIAFRDGERTFGDDAITAGMRSPSSVFTNVLHLLGKDVSHPIVQAYQQTHPQHNIEPHPIRNTVVFKINDELSFSVEELVAQLLSHARDQASAHTQQPVKDLVITVPSFFNQAERRALLDAAAIADLKVLSLISSNSAVALNYGMFRRKEINATAQHLLFYDMGSSQTTATVVAFQTVKTKDKGYSETNPQLTVLGVGFDRTLGGYEMQLRLRDFLAQKFNDMKKTSNNVFDNPRAMSKINKEAGRLKHVLSANNEHVSQIENVMEDIDLRVMVKRSDLERLIEDLVIRSSQPLNDALAAAGLDMSVIDQLVLVGGATRVPAVQEHLQKTWGRELSRNINADEAAALGAVYRAADMGQGFKVKTFHVKEANLYPIEVVFDRAVEQEDGSIVDRVVRRSLFAVGNLYPQKKVMTFNKHTADFDFRVNYGDMTETMTPTQLRTQFGSKTMNISYAKVRGVTDKFNKQVVEGDAEFKGIKAHFSMDGSGLLVVGDVELVLERNITVEEKAAGGDDEESTLTKIGSTLSKLFGGDEANATENAEAGSSDGDKDAAGDEKPANGSAAAADGSSSPTTVSKLVTDKIALNASQLLLDLPSFPADSLGQAKQKLEAINTAEAEREQRAAGRNSLETLILDIRDKMSQDEYIEASVAETQEVLTQQCSEMEDWLYEDGFDAEATTYKDKIAALQKVFQPVANRVEQHRQRPQAIEALNNMLNRSSDFMQRARGAPEDESWFTAVELQNLDDLIVSTQNWLEKAEEAQAELKLSEDPSLSLESIAEKITDLDREMRYLFNKAKIARAKADKEAAEAKAKAEKAAKEAEKEAKKAEKKKKKQQEEGVEEEDEESIIGDNLEGEPKGAEGDSRQEPALPDEPSSPEEPSVEDTRPEEISPDQVQPDEEPHTEL